MKLIRFGVAFLAASMSAHSPVAWATMDLAQKSAFNRVIRGRLSGTFNEVYGRNAHLFDDESRSVLEAWLANNGNQKVTLPQAQIVKNKNGKDVIKVVLSHQGKSASLSFTEGNSSHFDLNGTRIAFSEIRNISSMAAKAGQTDSSLLSLSKSIDAASLPPPKKSDLLSIEEFSRLKPIQRVEYMMLIRQTQEAAQDVFNEITEKQQVSNGKIDSQFVLHSLFSAEAAWAASSTVRSGDRCLVAGNISVYEKNSSGRFYCNPFPKSTSVQPSPTFHHLCDKSGSVPSPSRPQNRSNGRGNVACPSLLYEPQSNGRPYCQWSSDQPFFTANATANCNKMSPLKGAPGSKERLASYERILKGYFTLNGGNADQIKDCFNEESKVNSKCVSIFQPQLDAFRAFKRDADETCKTANRKASDQPPACEKLKERTLELINFVEQAKLLPVQPIEAKTVPVKTVDVRQANCEQSGQHWNEKVEMCLCPNGTEANYDPNKEKSQYDCPVAVAKQPMAKEKDECRKEDGSKKNLLKCNPAPWLLGLAGIVGLLWLVGGNKDKKPASQPTTLPTPVPTPVPPTQQQEPQTPTSNPSPDTLPDNSQSPGEGGSGKDSGQRGGSRGAQ